MDPSEQSNINNTEKNDTDTDDSVDPEDLAYFGSNDQDAIKHMVESAFKKQCKILEEHLFTEHDETTAVFISELLSTLMENMFAGKMTFTDLTIKIITDMKLKIEQDNTLLLKMKHNDNIPIGNLFKNVKLETLNAAIDKIPPQFHIDRDVIINKLSILFNINENNEPLPSNTDIHTSPENTDVDEIHLEI